MSRCADLLEEHRRFDDAVRSIREDVHRRRGDPTRMRWLDAALRRHVAVEEARLLPAFDLLEHPVPNGAPDVFRRDHRLILEQLDAVAAGWGDPVARAHGLGRLAGALDHHDRREARYLLPRLDREVAPEVVAAWLADHPPLDPLPAGSPAEEPPRDPPVAAPLDRARWWVATGRLVEAAAEVGAVASRLAGRGPGLAARTLARLHADDPVGAWDALALVIATQRPSPGQRSTT